MITAIFIWLVALTLGALYLYFHHLDQYHLTNDEQLQKINEHDDDIEVLQEKVTWLESELESAGTDIKALEAKTVDMEATLGTTKYQFDEPLKEVQGTTRRIETLEAIALDTAHFKKAISASQDDHHHRLDKLQEEAEWQKGYYNQLLDEISRLDAKLKRSKPKAKATPKRKGAKR